jgi:hypothetical protein
MMQQPKTAHRALPLTLGISLGLLVLAMLALVLGENGQASAAPAAPPVPASGLSPNGAPAPRLARLAFYATRPPGVPRQTFSAGSDNMIFVWLRWIGVTGAHDAYVTLTSPDGQVYQVLDVPFASAAVAAQPFAQKRPGLLHPVTVQIAQADGDGAVVWGEVPIAGTWMTRLPGAWTAAVTLDNHPQVVLSLPFTHTPEPPHNPCRRTPGNQPTSGLVLCFVVPPTVQGGR